MSNKIITFYQCSIYLADGKHISFNEPCENAREALGRAEGWKALGHKAIAFRVVIDSLRGKMYHYPLD